MGPEQDCALRALTLCDGQVLEEPDRTLHVCLCALEKLYDGQLAHRAATDCRIRRAELEARTVTF